MIQFSNWLISNPCGEVIARQYDNLSRTLTVMGDLPAGWDWAMLVDYGDKPTNVIALSPVGGGIGATLTADMIPYAGYYRMQLRGTQGEAVRHTNIIQVYIPESLTGEGQWPDLPSEFGQIEERMQELAGQAQDSADAADTSAKAAAESAAAAEGAEESVAANAKAAQDAANAAQTSEGNAKTSETNAAKSAGDAQTSAGQAADSATQAKTAQGEAEAAQTAAETAQGKAETAAGTATQAAQGAVTSATQASQSAQEAASAATAAQNAQEAAEKAQGQAEAQATAAAGSATAAQESAAAAAGSSSSASGSAQTAQTAAQNAQKSAETAQEARQGAQAAQQAIEDLEVSSETLEPDSPASVEKTVSPEGVVTLEFGIPRGPQGQPGASAPQINDAIITDANPWSSKNIVDRLCPPFEVEGNPVTCTPVEGYPLGVQVSWEPVQEGEGDPSPDNVRPISGRESVSVTRCADNIFHKLNLRLGKTIYYGGGVGAIRFAGDSKRAVFQIKCLPNRTYSFYNPQYQKYWLNRIALCNSDGTMGYQNIALYTDPKFNYESYTFTLQNHPATDLLIQFEKVDKSEFTQNDVDALTTMLIFGTTPPTAYEPYQGADYTLNLPETIYGGTLDAVTGVGSETWDCITSDSSLWSKVEYTDRTSFRAELFGATPDATRLIICDKATRSTSTAFSTQEIGSIRYNANTLQIACEKGTTKEQFAETYGVIQIAYPLAEPVPIQATGGQAIPALSGANTIYTDGDSVTVSGRADPLATIQAMQEQIAALTQHIAEGGTV